MKFLLIIAGLLLPAAAMAEQCGPARGTAGRYDYYLFSLSWAPSYCDTPAGSRDPRQCGPGASYGFVVHGLWPQYAEGRWPQCCQAVPAVKPSPTVDEVSRVMVSPRLRQHEWDKHGSCVTDRQDEYFGKINRAAAALGLAPALPAGGVERIRVSDLKRNWPVPPRSITVHCKGRRLDEVRICLDRELAPMPCPEAQVKSDNCPGTVDLH
ncbi:ribonuclease I [Paramagnetospirillum caucaseum]|uniref:Ribonuclease I n=1 Tax=Paramagnetospirillum caucaseum TaxID=1244869 RepID=M3AFU0_9PROT|nr:ribonuclease T2 [Paramagnetospirillum caucaseum]EME71434.1 ribonuclease I [Paramagnetospirillum caucaseum]